MKLLRLSVIVASLALLISGCLESEVRVALRYDPKDDSFHYLTIQHHIRSGINRGMGAPARPDNLDKRNQPDNTEADFASLKNLWLNRDHLIMLEPLRILGGPISYVRLSKDSYSVLSLENGKLSGEPVKTQLDLSQIQIRPGVLFQEGEDSLGYYHEIVVPGKFIDSLLNNAREDIARNPSSRDFIEKELLRRQKGGARASWEAFTNKTLADLQGKPAENAEPIEGPQCCLETQSLNDLKAAMATGKLDLGRRGAVFYVRLPLTAADSAEVQKFVEKIRPVLKEKGLEKIAGDANLAEADKQKLRDALDKISRGSSVSCPNTGGVELSVDVTPLGDLLWVVTSFPSTTDAAALQEQSARAKAMAQRAAKELAVSRDWTIQKIYDAFGNNTLPANPSAKPVTPGEGLGK